MEQILNSEFGSQSKAEDTANILCHSPEDELDLPFSKEIGIQCDIIGSSFVVDPSAEKNPSAAKTDQCEDEEQCAEIDEYEPPPEMET